MRVEQIAEPLFVVPTVAHAAGMHRIVRESDALDENSRYAYLLMATHFRETCVVAEAEGAVVGFVAGYCPPSDPRTIFVWQVGVAASHRRQGLGGALLERLLAAPACAKVSHLEASVTPSNAASRALFQRFADSHDANLSAREWFPTSTFGSAGHEPEILLRVGPLTAHDSARNKDLVHEVL